MRGRHRLPRIASAATSHTRRCPPAPIVSRLPTCYSLADEMQRDFAFMRPQPVLPKIDALPRAQREAGAGERNRKLDGGQRGANVSSHVIGTFVAMAEERIAIGHETREETLEVAAHVGIGILLDDESRRS